MVKTILITGASSGIGKALAAAYAKEGIRLYLLGRNKENLENIKSICESKKAEVEIKIIDVKNQKEMADFISSLPSLDIIFANAGISSGTSTGDEKIEVIKDIFDTNLYGAIYTISPAIERFKQEKKGQIVIISSLASYRGMAGSPAYCASKAAIRVYGEALRDLLFKDNIKVNIVCPGFVKSGITDKNKFKMPFLMSSEKSASIIIKGVESNKAVIAYPFVMAFMAWFIMVIPTGLSSFITRLLPKK